MRRRLYRRYRSQFRLQRRQQRRFERQRHHSAADHRIHPCQPGTAQERHGGRAGRISQFVGGIAGCRRQSTTRVFAFTKDKFNVLFPNEHTTATEMLAVLEREMRADPRFELRLALN